MRVLMLAHRIPYPPHTGDKTRAYHMARYLGRRHDVTLACLVDAPADLAGVDALRELVSQVELARVWKPWNLVKGFGALAVGASLSLPYFNSRSLRRRVARRVRERPFDVVYASSTPMAQYVRSWGIPVVMDFVDVDSDKWRQYGSHSRPPMSWLYHTEGRRLQSCEAEIAGWAQLSLLATSAEESLLRSFAPWARTAVIRNGIDLDYFRPIGRDTTPAAVIFTGAMDYLPNIDAVRHFCVDILPRIRRATPTVRFYIVGVNPSAQVRRLAEIPGVVVTGTVPDVRPYYAQAAVCVAPLRIGRGVQNKVLQAMAMGLPVVASSIAQRGLDAQPGRHLYVEDDPSGFASRVVSLLGSSPARTAMVGHARAFVEAHHAWDTSCSQLDEILDRVTRQPADGARSSA